MEDKEITLVSRIINDLINLTKIEYELSKELYKLEINNNLYSEEYKSIINKYTLLEESIDIELNKLNGKSLILADNILMGLVHEIKENPFTTNNIRHISVLRINKRIDSLRNIKTNNEPIDKLVELINLTEKYDTISSLLYYLNLYINNSNNINLNKELIKFKHDILFVTYIVEKTYMDNHFQTPEKLVLNSNYYIEKYTNGRFLVEDNYRCLLVDKIKDIINLEEKDLKDISKLKDLIISLSFIRTASLKIDNYILKELGDHAVAKSDKVTSLLKNALLSSVNEKHKVYYLKKIQ